MEPVSSKRQRLIRAIGLTTILAGLTTVVYLATSEHWLTAAYFLIGGSIVTLAQFHESIERQRRLHLSDANALRMPPDEREVIEVKDGLEQLSRQWWQDAALVGLLAIMAFGTIYANAARSRLVGNQVVMGSEAKDLSLHLGPELERAMLDALHRMQGSGSGTTAGSTGTAAGFSWETVLLAAIAAALLAWTVKKRPSAAPVVGAAELALAAIKNADKLSSLDRWMFWVAMIVFVGMAVVFLGVGLWRMRNDDEGRVDSDDDGSRKKIDSPMAIGFSALILGWAVILVAYHKPAEATPQNQPKVVTSAKVVSMKKLTPVPLFGRGRSEIATANAYSEMKQAFTNSRKEGDRLLLLGSADCMEIHKSAKDNLDLARTRATKLKEQLLRDHAAREDEIEIDLLPQYTRCAETKDLRGVFPFLAHAETVEK